VFHDFSLDSRAGDQRRSSLWRITAEEQDFIEPECFAHLAVEPLDRDDLVFANPVLFSAAADNREHAEIP
jgi:hypothetical protein